MLHPEMCYPIMSVRIELFAGETRSGTVDADVIDASRGVIGGILKPTAAYYAEYQDFFQAPSKKLDWNKLEALRLNAISTLTGQLTAEGVDITDMMDQFSVETVDVNIVGITHQQMAKLFPDS
ncbi:hypothetical protein HMJ29_18270 [Hymenobacter taeanensis]|uniref:Uncharacterized protein n=1 Tax=Hymenobacter taeanensis TaxID=2735321 RepID=A0A6M6BNZ9_9BACT|nr:MULTISPECIES: hypothetical protein [Hymenobacter]QJX48755.1 hypothetical protein HMJ29_18270 [Hymenobacter taeanensis]UOQ81739.1 hypothetical protein MUN83_02805 [Hymenobacter sp. 5414T-23]